MAQPKKKMSRSKRDSRRANWNNKIKKQVISAVSLAKSVLNSRTKNFILSSD